MANEYAYMTDEQLLEKLGPENYQRLRSLGMLGNGRGYVQPLNTPGLPSPDEIYGAQQSAAASEYSPEQIAEELDYVNQFSGPEGGREGLGRSFPYIQRFGENDEYLYARLPRGREKASYRLTGLINQREELEANATERLLRAGRDTMPGPMGEMRVMEAPHEALSRAFGIEVTPEAGLRAQQLAEAAQLPASKALQLAQLELEGGLLARRQGRNRASADLLREIAIAGEISPDPIISEANRQLKEQLRRIQTADSTEIGDLDQMVLDDREFSLSPSDTIQEDILVRAAQQAGATGSGSRLRPYRQLTEEQTKRLGEMSGKDRTRKRLPDEAVVMRAPGSVLSAGMEFDPRGTWIPLLAALKNQVNQRTGELQIQQVYAGKNDLGQHQFLPTLTKASTIYVNPYAELPDEVVQHMGLDPILIKQEKDVTGALDANMLNVPVPDVGQSRHGLTPRDDPSFGARGGQAWRNPTFGEAVQTLLLKNATPIKDYELDMLEQGGQAAKDRVNGRDVFALGGKFDPVTREPMPIASYSRQPDADGSVPTVSVRVGGKKKYQETLYKDVDDLVTAMIASHAGEFQQGADGRVAPRRQYGLMVNLAPNAIPGALLQYQRKLLEEAGVPLPSGHGNPLQAVLNFASELGKAPTNDMPRPQVLLPMAEGERIVAQDGRFGLARKLQDIKEQILARQREPNNLSWTRAALDELARRTRQGPDPRRFDSRGQYYLPGFETSREYYLGPEAPAEEVAATPTRQAIGQLELDLRTQEARDPRQLAIPGLAASVPTLGWPRDVEAGVSVVGRPFTRPSDTPGTPSWPVRERSAYEQAEIPLQSFPRVAEGPALPGSPISRVKDPEALERSLDAMARAMGWTSPRRR